MKAHGYDYRRPRLRRLLLLAAAALAVSGFATVPRADESDLDLVASQTAFDRLGPDVSAESASFLVDQATQIRVEVTTSLDGLATSILGPAGQVINPATVGSFGGTYVAFGGDAADSFLIIPTSRPGYHHVYAFPSLGVGTYTVSFSASASLTDSVPVISELLTDSPVAATLVAAEPSFPAGVPAVLVAAVFESGAPRSGASVTVAVKPPTSSEFSLTLHDDGLGADGAAGDGLYTGAFTSTETGAYNAVAQITGLSGAGTPYARLVGTGFAVVPARAAFAGTTTDAAVDDNANGLYDRVVLTAQVDVIVAGTFGLHVTLRTAGGKALEADGSAALAAGSQTVSASFPAPLFLAAGEDGPYVVESAELVWVGASGVEPCDWMTEGTQNTQAYLLTQFERPTLELTGVNAEQGVDLDSDGDFDQLVARAGIRVAVAGTYSYTAHLVDPCGEQIEFVSGQQAFPSGSSPEALVLTFSGTTIGSHGVDGPYAVRDLLVYGTGGSLSAGAVMDTQAYTASQFDSFLGPPDCDGDGRPDLCEIVQGLGTDCNGNFHPDVCDVAAGTSTDCNGDLVPDECQADCNTNGVPDSCELVGVPYAIDDGSAELSLGAGGGDMIWLNRFNVAPSGGTIDTLHVAWGYGIPDGLPTTVLLYSDPSNDGDPTDAVLLASQVVGAANADTGIFTEVPIPPTFVGNPGQSFFVGAFMSYPSTGYPAVQDSSSASQLRSWVQVAGTGGIDINNLSLNPPFLIDSAGYPGNWFLRATAAGSPLDCNANLVPDSCDIVAGTSRDVNGNGVPDECDPGQGAGDVPAGTPLRISKATGSDLALSWGGSCLAEDTDYAVYEGAVGAFTTHVPLSCTTSGATAVNVTPGSGSRYYLVVPRNLLREGSYGRGVSGAERPTSTAACATQMLGSCP